MTDPQKLRKQLEGWFATSFWVDAHYALACLGTLVVFAVHVITKLKHPELTGFDAGFAAFVTGMWVTAVGNDKINMPPTPPDGGVSS